MHDDWGHHSEMSKLCRYQSCAITRGFKFCCFLVFNAQVTYLTAIMTLTPFFYHCLYLLWNIICKGEAVLAQCWKHSPSTSMAWVWFPDEPSFVEWVCWFSLYSVLRVFSSGTPDFPSQQKPTWNFDLICSDSVWLVLSSIRKAAVLCLIQWDLNKVISLIFVEEVT